MVEQQKTRTELPPLKSRLNQWIEEVEVYQTSGEEDSIRVDELLNSGYQIFFDTIKPLADAGLLSAENPCLLYTSPSPRD